MLDAEMFRRRARDLRLVIFLLRETDRERLHLRVQPAHESRENSVRINPAAKQEPEGNIASQAHTDALIELCADEFTRFFITARQLRPLRVAPIALHFNFTRSPGEEMRRRQLDD